MSEPGSYVKRSDPMAEHNRRVKDSQLKHTPRYQQNRGQVKDWESSGGKETQEVTDFNRESDVQLTWRRAREHRIQAAGNKDARSAKVSHREQSPEANMSPRALNSNNHAPERGDVACEIKKLDNELQNTQITEGWTDSQFQFERRKAAKKAGVKIEELNRKVIDVKAVQGETRRDREWTGQGNRKEELSEAQRNWIAKKQSQEDVLWNEGGTWLKSQTQPSAPSSILHKYQQSGREGSKEEMGFDINVPKAYRNRPKHVTEAQGPEEQRAWDEVRGRPRDQYYAGRKLEAKEEFPVAQHEPERQQFQIPSARPAHFNTEHDEQWAQGKEWLTAQIQSQPEDPPGPPAEPEVTYSMEPVPHPAFHQGELWREYLVEAPYSAQAGFGGPMGGPEFVGGPGFPGHLGPHPGHPGF